MITVALLCMTCADRLAVADANAELASDRVDVQAREMGWVRVVSALHGRPHTADVCKTCALTICKLVDSAKAGGER